MAMTAAAIMTMEKAGIGAEEHSRDGTFPTAPIPDLKFNQLTKSGEGMQSREHRW